MFCHLPFISLSTSLPSYLVYLPPSLLPSLPLSHPLFISLSTSLPLSHSPSLLPSVPLFLSVYFPSFLSLTLPSYPSLPPSPLSLSSYLCLPSSLPLSHPPFISLSTSLPSSLPPSLPLFISLNIFISYLVSCNSHGISIIYKWTLKCIKYRT